MFVRCSMLARLALQCLPCDKPPHLHHCCCYIRPPIMNICLSPSSSPPPSAQAGPSHANMGSVNNPIIVGDGDERRWPSDYYVVDIAGCLCECSARTSLRKNLPRTQKAVFEEFFPMVRFVPATFTDQKKLWRLAFNSLRDESIEAGRTKKGLWSLFARRVCAEKKALSQEVIDID